MALKNCPLNDQHCQLLTATLQSCAETQQAINACKEAGIDMSDAEEKNRQQAIAAAALKRVYFPQSP